MKVCLIGGSNSIKLGGLQTGISDALKKLNENIDISNEFINYSLGGTSSIHRIYEVLRHKEQINACDLLIVDSFFNDLDNEIMHKDADIKIVERNIHYLYNELAKLKTKVVVLFIAYSLFNENNRNHQYVYNIHKYYSNYYNINAIDMHGYFTEQNLLNFLKKPDPIHPLLSIMYEIGKNIINNYVNIKSQKFNKTIEDFGLEYIACEKYTNIITKTNIKNSMYNENAIVLSDNTLNFNISPFTNKYLLGFHSWNYDDKIDNWTKSITNMSLIKIENQEKKLILTSFFLNYFSSILTSFKIDKSSYICFEKQEKINEKANYANHCTQNAKKHEFVNLIGILVSNKLIEFNNDDIKEKYNENINLKNNLNIILPDTVFAKTVLEEYNQNVLQKEYNIKNESIATVETILKDLQTFRLDIHMINNFEPFDIKCNSKLLLDYPSWYRFDNGYGVCIVNTNTAEKKIHISFVSQLDTEITLNFCGICKRDKNKKTLPFWTNYTNVIINNISYGNFSTWHDKQKYIKLQCKKGDRIEIYFEINSYKYTNEELRNLLKNYYNIENETILKLVFAFTSVNFNYF
ncbi:hypothetical protein AVBRAN12640_09555 [Campylobacter sp. RM12640]|uniref:hypothetical protein n=1 Tax=unclassified Campylobacter TaxID=2593542 RepID=UPI00301452F1|nr:hypothetical protein [Campylobacter sp. RM12640]MBZ7990020.1 hypothetical protein [Campylobacter sp. RM12635]